ncbi:MAG: type II toxin-antitoxin system Phd/YefM family antitoxin [Gemmatimonadales bacterium]
MRRTNAVDPKTMESAGAAAVRSRGGTPLAAFRNRRGEQVEPSLLSATAAKNEFGRVMETVLQGGVVVVTKHDAPKAVIMSVEEFNALSAGAARELNTLASEFDALLDRMQTPKVRAGMKAAFDASAEELGKAAVKAARKRA